MGDAVVDSPRRAKSSPTIHTEKQYNTIIVTGILILVGFFSVFPLFWMISTSLKEGASLYAYPPQLIPRPPSLSAYITLFRNSRFPVWFANSCIVTGITIILTILTSSLSGYAFAKMDFPGRVPIFIIIISTLMIPYFILCLPLFIVMAKVKLVNTYLALILPQIANPVAIFILKQYTETIPNELISAAKIDGAGEVRTFSMVIFPLITPAVAAVAIFSFLNSWNSFFWPLIATTSARMRTLPVGLAILQGQFSSEWALVSAGAFISMLPALILYIFLQKYFVQGIAMTGVKG